MFHLPQIFLKYSHKNINAVRNLRKMPGIYKTQKILPREETGTDLADFEELEADFTSLNISHREFINESAKFREKEKLSIIKQKYFKEKAPNFLTWADKLQIRFLHKQDPEEWTIDKLSEGFPALPGTIKAILKGHWTKNNVNKIKHHDTAVCSNWNYFKQRKLELPKELIEHLKKFTNRSLNFNYSDFEEEIKPKTPMVTGEFSEIIESYEELKSKQNNQEKINENETVFNNKFVDKNRPLEQTYTTEEKSNYQLKSNMTLDALENYLGKKISRGEELSTDDKLILSSPFKNEQVKTEEIELKVVKYVDNRGKVSTYNRKKKDYSHLNYPHKIIIPNELFNKANIYKLNDCYYDKRGYFLYRVPGME